MRRLRIGVLATGLVLGLTVVAPGQVCPTTMGMAGGTTNGGSTAGTSASSGRVGTEFPPVAALSSFGPQSASARQQMLLARARRAAMLRAAQNQASVQVPPGMGVLAQATSGTPNQQRSTTGQDSSSRSSRAAARRAEGAERALAYAKSAESHNRLTTATKYYRRVVRVAPGSTAAGEAQQALDRLAPNR